MQIVVIQALGVLIFLFGSIGLAIWIRRQGHARAAAGASRVSHTLFWIGLIIPGTVGLIYPGLGSYDEILGIPSLPVRPVWVVTGIISLFGGLVLLARSNRLLFKRGRGSAAFLLTNELVRDSVYGCTRNPMALGFYGVCLGIGMIAGSMSVTLGIALVVVPAHMINLKYFEEYELELRFGRSYVDYRSSVPFLVPSLTNVCGRSG